NAHRSFLCRDQPLAVENVQTAWTRGCEAGQIIRIPLKNQDGQYVADERTLAQLEDEGRVVFRYAAGAPHCPAGFEQNPNSPRHPAVAGRGPPVPASGPSTGGGGLATFTSVLTSLSCWPRPAPWSGS